MSLLLAYCSRCPATIGVLLLLNQSKITFCHSLLLSLSLPLSHSHTQNKIEIPKFLNLSLFLSAFQVPTINHHQTPTTLFFFVFPSSTASRKLATIYHLLRSTMEVTGVTGAPTVTWPTSLKSPPGKLFCLYFFTSWKKHHDLECTLLIISYSVFHLLQSTRKNTWLQ